MTEDEVQKLWNTPFYLRNVILRDGTIATIRPLIPEDRSALIDGLRSLSSESRLCRFFFDKREFSEEELQKLTHPDGLDHIAFVMEISARENTKQMPVAVARCFRDSREASLGEVAVVTRDEWQGNGVATELLRTLSAAAQSVGIRYWFAAVFCEHRVIRELLERFGEVCKRESVGSGVVELTYKLYERDDRF